MSDDALVKVTVGHTTYAAYEDLHQHEARYDIFMISDRGYRYFGTFQDPKYLDEKALEEYIRENMRLRTGIA